MSSTVDPGEWGLPSDGRGRPERAGHGRRNPFGLGDAGQLDQPGAIPVFLAEGGGHLHRQSGLADPAGADQRHQPAGANRLAQLLELGLDARRSCSAAPAGCPPRCGRGDADRSCSRGRPAASVGSWARTRASSSRRDKPGSIPSSSTKRSRISV